MRTNDNNPVEPLCIDIPAVGSMLGISRATAYEMARLGQLPVIRCGTRRMVVPLAALKRMLEEAGQYNPDDNNGVR
ncbi:MAG: helix-turn-helix domain-containing protein [Dehalococcoidales bacterium]|nr:helix-turn-helix domain-containing protein [Dehalococcoidales bacterium]